MTSDEGCESGVDNPADAYHDMNGFPIKPNALYHAFSTPHEGTAVLVTRACPSEKVPYWIADSLLGNPHLYTPEDTAKYLRPISKIEAYHFLQDKSAAIARFALGKLNAADEQGVEQGRERESALAS